MLAEFVKQIAQLAETGVSAERKVKLLEIPGAPAHKKVLVNADGKLENYELPPSPRTHKLLSVAEIVPFIALLQTHPLAKPAVWVGNESIIVIHDDTAESRRLDRTTVNLTLSPHFQLLQEWASRPAEFNHKRFLSMLRRNFKDAIPNLDNLLTILRKATFREGKSLTSEATRTRSSIGAECTRELQLESTELPDVISINVSAFDDPAINFGGIVRCLLEVDDESKLWSLVPIVGECERVLDDTLSFVCAELRRLVPPNVPVVYGTP